MLRSVNTGHSADLAVRLLEWLRHSAAHARLALLLAVATALAAPGLARGQGIIGASIDAKTTTSGTTWGMGNWIVPSGSYTLTAQGGA